MKVAYAGYDEFFFCLEAIEKCGHTIGAVYSFKTDDVYDFHSRIQEYAIEHALPYTEERITYAELEKLKNQGFDCLFCAGYLYKLPVLPDFIMINFHPAMLPSGRGPWPMPAAILREVDSYGVTIHKISAEFDAGDILIQKGFPLSKEENLETLRKKIQESGTMITEALFQKSEFMSYYENAKKQDGVGEYWEDPTDASHISFTDTAGKILKVLRAFYGYPVYYKSRSGHVYTLKNASLLDIYHLE